MSKKPQSVEKRLVKFILKTDTCWLWQGHINRGGYGQFTCYGVHRAHRFVYEYLVGPIPDGMALDHLCGVKHCVKPDHLEVVTHAENTARWAKTVTACPQGHSYTDENLYVRSDGRKKCKTCDRDRNRMKYQQKLQSISRGSRVPHKNVEGRPKKEPSNATA